MFCTRKTEPLKVFSWKFENSCRNAATLIESGRLVFHAKFESIDRFLLELQGGGIESVDVEERGHCQGRAVKVETARLVASRIAGVDQQVGVGLVRQYRRARQLVLIAGVCQRHAIKLGSGVALARQRKDAARNSRPAQALAAAARAIACFADRTRCHCRNLRRNPLFRWCSAGPASDRACQSDARYYA